MKQGSFTFLNGPLYLSVAKSSAEQTIVIIFLILENEMNCYSLSTYLRYECSQIIYQGGEGWRRDEQKSNCPTEPEGAHSTYPPPFNLSDTPHLPMINTLFESGTGKHQALY